MKINGTLDDESKAAALPNSQIIIFWCLAFSLKCYPSWNLLKWPFLNQCTIQLTLLIRNILPKRSDQLTSSPGAPLLFNRICSCQIFQGRKWNIVFSYTFSNHQTMNLLHHPQTFHRSARLFVQNSILTFFCISIKLSWRQFPEKKPT